MQYAYFCLILRSSSFVSAKQNMIFGEQKPLHLNLLLPCLLISLSGFKFQVYCVPFISVTFMKIFDCIYHQNYVKFFNYLRQSFSFKYSQSDFVSPLVFDISGCRALGMLSERSQPRVGCGVSGRVGYQMSSELPW